MYLFFQGGTELNFGTSRGPYPLGPLATGLILERKKPKLERVYMNRIKGLYIRLLIIRILATQNIPTSIYNILYVTNTTILE